SIRVLADARRFQLEASPVSRPRVVVSERIEVDPNTAGGGEASVQVVVSLRGALRVKTLDAAIACSAGKTPRPRVDAGT
ncbi:MAG TPA: hypothetical protein VF085_04665, partial [Solirubrobacterales bacterium]